MWTPDDPMPAVTVEDREVRGLHDAYVHLLGGGEHGHALVYMEPARHMRRAFKTYRTWDHDTAFMRQLQDLGTTKVAYLQRIKIEQNARQRGLGTYLLKATLAWIDAQGIRTTFLHAQPFGLGEGPCVVELENWYGHHGFTVAEDDIEEDGDFSVKSSVLMRRDRRR